MSKEEKGNKFDLGVLKRLLGFMKPYKYTSLCLLVMMLLSSTGTVLRPMLIGEAIDQPLSQGNASLFQHIIIYVICILFLEVIFQYFIIYLSGWIGQTIVHDLRVRLYRHILNLKTQFYDKTPIGQLVTRNVSDIETLSDVFSQGIAAMTADIITLLFIIGAMFYENWRLALICLATLPFLLTVTYIFKEKMKVAFAEVRNAVSKLNTFVQERISGMMVVQIFNAEERESQKFDEINKVHQEANIKTVKYYSIYFPVAEFIGAVGLGLLVWSASKGVLAGWVEGKGQLITFIMYLSMFFRPIRMIGDRFNTLQLGVVSTSRIIKLLDDTSYIPDNGTLAPSSIKGKISFDNVRFSYTQGEEILKGISFDLDAGKTMAIVGSTGAGKTTIINLLNRFYSIDSGKINIDQHPIDSYKLESLRTFIGVVQQDVFLFSDSIYNNIVLGNPKITKEKVYDTIKMVGADSFIDQLPNQLDYKLQERGANLSVGQRQLLAFVRALVYDPKVIVLDEATSSIDTESELLIQNAIDKLMKGRTAIVIAHRLSTIQKADTIVVMEKGKIVESGTHTELLKNKKHYSQLYEIQYK